LRKRKRSSCALSFRSPCHLRASHRRSAFTFPLPDPTVQHLNEACGECYQRMRSPQEDEPPTTRPPIQGWRGSSTRAACRERCPRKLASHAAHPKETVADVEARSPAGKVFERGGQASSTPITTQSRGRQQPSLTKIGANSVDWPYSSGHPNGFNRKTWGST